jgi:two-component SAPR family response regulator
VSQGYVRISILTNEIGVDGVALALPNRESELLTLLALCGGYADAISLASAMWPHAESNKALARLWSSVMELRKSLPNPSMLHNEQEGYALDAALSVDLWQIDAYLRSHRCATRSRCGIDNLLYRRLVRFHYTHRYRVLQWAWSLSIRSLIETYRRDVGLWLGWGFLAEERVYEAHSVATQLVATYPSCASSRGLLETVERRLADAYLMAAPRAG